MLTSKPSASSKRMGTTTTKSLNTRLPSEEAKSPETEPKKQRKSIKPAVTKEEKEEKYSMSDKKGSYLLSSRASAVKKNLSRKQEVDAIILKPDGSAEQIKYNTSSKQANKLLNGRPTIIGELEGIQTVIARSLNQTNCGELNKHTLPVPFCNKQYNGNYLLYRVDSNGNAINLSLKQYEQFVLSNKTLTENAQKNYDPIDNQEIKAKSSFSSNSRLTLVYLRSEVDKKIRQEFKEKDNDKPSESEIEDKVNESLQKLVNDLVLSSTSSPMNDPDYNPDEISNDDGDYINKLKEIYRNENGVDISNDDLVSTLCSTQNILNVDDDVIDERDWRLQLNDALNYVRERGKLDGRALATKISETFYELNGVEPTLDELVDVFRKIKLELAEEAQSEIDDDAEQDINDNGSAYYLAQKLASKFENANPSDLVDYAFRIVREDIVNRSKSLFVISRGRNPNKNELKETVERLALKLADDAINYDDNDDVAFDDDDKINDPDYNPNNIKDNKLKYEDQIEDEQWNENNFNLKMFKTKRTKSKRGNAESYDVFFCKYDKEKEKENLLKAIDSFKIRNRREPNKLEIYSLKQFITTSNKETSLIQFKLSQVDGDSDNEYDEEEKDAVLEEKEFRTTKPKQTTPSKVLVTPIKKKKSAARYNVYFNNNNKLNENRNNKLAIKWFKRFNDRNPTEKELDGIQQFINADKSGLTECEYNVPIDSDDNKESDNYKTDKFVVNKKNKSTKYTLNFNYDQNAGQSGNEKQAIKWFKVFNNRNPTDYEIKQIQQFVQTDNEQEAIIDID